MNNRRVRALSVFGAACVLTLGGLACGSRSDSDASGGNSSTSSTAAPAPTSTTEDRAAASSTTMSAELDIFCTNAKPLGFNSLADINPLDPAEARELQTKLELLEASAPAEAGEILVAIRVITDPYLVAVVDGEITTSDQVIEWAGTLDVPTLDASLAAVAQMKEYIAANCA